MKKMFSIALFFFLIIAQVLPGWSKETEPYLVKDFDMKAGGKLQTFTNGGSITVTGTSDKKASVALIVTDQNGRVDKSRIEELLKKYKIDIRKDNQTLYATAERIDKNWKGNNELSISFRIKVPHETTCNVNTSGGSISLNNVKGNSELKTSGGSIALQQYQGALEAKTSGGSISLSDSEGKLNVQTSGGSISLQKVSGDIAAQTSGGSISADILKLGKFLTLETTGGSVTATIPGGKGLDLDLSGTNVKAELSNFKGESDRNKIKGSINGGGIPVKLSTSGGSTRLNFRS